MGGETDCLVMGYAVAQGIDLVQLIEDIGLIILHLS